MLPQLRDIERRFPAEVVIVGVHSGKYTTERRTERIREAVNRLDVAHGVVNDRQYRIWRSYAVRAWPTLVVVDPNGRVLASRPGEFTAEMLAPSLERIVAAYDEAGVLDRRPIDHALDPPAVAPGTLRYPGKVAVAGDRMAIADSGHHRVLVGRLEAAGHRLRVERVVGGGERGFADGADASFDTPNGLALDGDVLYVADSGNHAVRRISLADGAVATVAGTGRQLRTRADFDAGALSSPWDLALVGGTLYVAMAGTHQIHAIDARTGARRVHAGSGAEELHDAPHDSAALAQPMGIVAADGALWIADSESSAIRRVDLGPDGGVRTIVGTGLFDFGDRDGAGDEVRMQHQQALAWHADGRLLVADSYNDSLKWVDPASRLATTWVDGLAEPGGLALGDRLVYVADTNAHRVAVVEERSGAIETLEIAM